MRNVAVPYKEIKLAKLRAIQINDLNSAHTISAAERAASLARLEADADALINEYSAKRNDISAMNLSDDNRVQALTKCDEMLNELLKPLQSRIEGLKTCLTTEERDSRIEHLRGLEAEYKSRYGMQPLTKDDRAQAAQDAQRRQEYVEKEKYADDRAEQYAVRVGSPNDQLDELWRAIALIAAAVPGLVLPPSVKEKLKSIDEIKNEFPKQSK